MDSKVCTQCNELLTLDKFNKAPTGKYGKHSQCKECMKRHVRTRIGLVQNILSGQKSSAKQRNYAKPAYTTYELYAWIVAQPHFEELFKAWEDSNYQNDLRPSVDRINDYISYRLDNIQLTTRKQNVDRYHTDRIAGINTKMSQAVDMLDLDGNFIQRFHSIAAADAHFGRVSHGNIQEVCQNKIRKVKQADGSIKEIPRLTSYGHKWRYSSVPNVNKEIL